MIRDSVYKKHFLNKELFKVQNSTILRGVNNSVINIVGKINDQIVLDSLNDTWLDVVLLVVEDHTMNYDILLGREFFQDANIKLVYYKGAYSFEKNNENDDFICSIFVMEINEKRERYDGVMESLDKNLPLEYKNKIRELLKEIDELEIEPVNDGYCARVFLKDESLFWFNPRRMSVQERKELEEIIDDLLKREIIKTSISLYCSRVVLVPKRNGKSRMCVDLRPLNQRIHRQKYPFPIMEDQLDKLYGKKIFTKLDLKNGFHQILIHPESTKFFAFATPNGQYEYTKLPFGFSESPAEFQKWILDIFKELVRNNKVQIYIDDILIATNTIEENLEILKEVLSLLKRYCLEVNFANKGRSLLTLHRF